MAIACAWCGQLGLAITEEPAIRCRYCQAPSVDEPRRTVADGIANCRAERQRLAEAATYVREVVSTR
jgi:DNA-directed RNA polymerase subunit RPC12/RpoP